MRIKKVLVEMGITQADIQRAIFDRYKKFCISQSTISKICNAMQPPNKAHIDMFKHALQYYQVSAKTISRIDELREED